MRRGRALSFDLFGDRLPAARAGTGDGGAHRRMLRVLTRAARGELTARQLECVRLYYGEGETVSAIAARLGVTPPTVSKHLKKARRRLEKVMRYYCRSPGAEGDDHL